MTAFRPTTVSPSSCRTSRRTPCMDGWLGPKFTSRMSDERRSSSGTSIIVGTGEGMRVPS